MSLRKGPLACVQLEGPRTPGRGVGWQSMRVGWKKPVEQQEYLENFSSLIKKVS